MKLQLNIELDSFFYAKDIITLAAVLDDDDDKAMLCVIGDVYPAIDVIISRLLDDGPRCFGNDDLIELERFSKYLRKRPTQKISPATPPDNSPTK